MSDSTHCSDRFHDIVALVMSELGAEDVRMLEAHLAHCEHCRAARKMLEEEEQEVRSGFDAIAERLGPIERVVLAGRQPPPTVGVSHSSFPERGKGMIFAHKRIYIAAAAVAALAAGLIVYVSHFSLSPSAYALEQTVAANDQITSYHVRITPAAELGEAWVELNPDGSPLRARMDIASPEDGPKVAIVSADKAEIWFQKKNSLVFIRDEKTLAAVTKMRAIFDPKAAFEEIQAAQQAGKADVKTEEPSNKGGPVKLTVVAKASPDRREVYEVDPNTKLVQQATVYRLQGGQWVQAERREYLDYNQPIDPTVFQPDIPKDVIVVDQINNVVGIARGDLSDNEISKEVVRQFGEALVAKDYQKAAQLFEGVPAGFLRERIEKMGGKFLRVVEVGEPTPAPDPRMHALRVPLKMEVEKDGVTGVQQFSPFVRPVHGQPDRWTICGGF